MACDNSVTGFGVAVCDSDNGTFVLGNYRALHPDSTFFVIDVAAVISFPVCIVHVMEMLIVHISVHMILAELSKPYNEQSSRSIQKRFWKDVRAGPSPSTPTSARK